MAALGHEDLRHLQQAIVGCFVAGQLEDGSALPRFPDLDYVLEADELVISTQNLADGLDGPDRRLASHEQITEMARVGEVPFLEFKQPEIDDDLVRLAVDVCLGFAELEPLRLGALIFAFERGPGDAWTRAGQPLALAY